MFKTYLLLSALILLVPTKGDAQFPKSIGAKIACTSAAQVFDYTDFRPDFERRTGVNAAVFLEWFDGAPFSLVTQLEYAQRGMRLKFAQIGQTGPEIIGYFYQYNRIDYLSLPIVAKLSLPYQTISPYAIAGLRLDFMLGYKSDGNSFNSVYDGFAKTIYGATFGAGAELKVFQGFPVVLEARYNLDLKNSYKTQYLQVKNNSIDVWLGIAYVI
jgi:hypothetical protein